MEAVDGISIETARDAAGSMRRALDGLTIPGEVFRAIVTAWCALGPDGAVAVRSSATAEDLPDSSFACQRIRVDGTRGFVQILELE